ncbi:heavy metal translocating P-type ATPase [Rhodoluna sp. KAS3]|uniref:heavy metal translocating P-type ATPase n=1 Tax=Rhodoluna sp. KAS3 TaxID=942880 RepID=UPI00222EF98D|nr:heavy metal translocating P-type ATPase [Rhodoluna sp. KAS3]BDS49461.1 ATPase P [Rhodoluna sp. KAS3]
MSKVFRNNYFLVGATLLSLAIGLTLQYVGSEFSGQVAFGVGASIGLYLSSWLLIRAIKNREMGSDVLALISILATMLTGEWLAASVVSVMLASGRALETWAEGRAQNQLKALLDRAPRVAHVIRADSEIVDIGINDVQVGDRLLVRSGEVVPIDGKLVNAGTFDESALTGEPLPVYRAAQEAVQSGVLNSDGQVELVTTATSANSTYSNLIRLVQEAQANTANGVRVANRWAVAFVPFAIGLSLLTWVITGELSTAVAVIVAATPCPLILAVPVAVISGMSRAASLGAIIKGGAALEQLARAKTVLLDKTGTLTQGGPEISTIRFADGTDGDLVLNLAASLDQSSPHVVARALVTEAKRRGLSLSQATEVSEVHGHGLSGTVQGHQVTVGQPSIELPEWASLQNALLVAVTVDGKLSAIIGLDDPLRDESKTTVQNLRKLGVDRVILVSGDRQTTATDVGQAVGADEAYGACSPEQKLVILRSEMSNSKGAVIAVGDGINDAPALAAAHVGVAMGARGATAASEAADVVIVEDSIRHLALAIDAAQGARKRALQAAGVGMGLAMVAMFAAAFGFINATGSAVSQEAIDVAAILWALVPPKKRV